jgi:hypothetical protein
MLVGSAVVLLAVEREAVGWWIYTPISHLPSDVLLLYFLLISLLFPLLTFLS